MKTDSIRKNYLLNTIFQIFSLIVPIITQPYIARVFEPSGVGIRSYTTSMMSVCMIFAVLGTSIYGQQVIAQCRDSKKDRTNNFWGIEFVSIITTIIATICWLIFAFAYKEYRLFLIVLTIRIIAAAFDISWYFAALERFSLIVVRNIVIKLITIVLLFALIKSKEDLLLYMIIESVGVLACNLSMWVPLFKSVEKVRFNEIELKKHFGQTLIYFLPTIAASVYSYIDKTMIGVITKSNTENGYYEQAQSIIHMAYTLVASLNTVMASRIAYLFSQKCYDEIKSKLRVAMIFVMSLSIPLTVGLIGVADNFVPWFFGPGYEKVVMLLKICSPLIILLSVHNYLAAQYLVPSGQRARSTIGVIAGAVANFCCNAILIPKYQSVGAIIATIIAEIVICGVYFYMSKSYISLVVLLKCSIKPLLSASAMLGVVWLIGHNHNGSIIVTIIQVVAGSIVYAFVLLLLGNEIMSHFKVALMRRLRKK